MMRKITGAKPAEIEADFEQRVLPGLSYCRRVGNIMGGGVLLALASTIDHGNFQNPARIGYFSYGSGCCSEFLSGIVRKEGQIALQQLKIGQQLDQRYALSMEEYDYLLSGNSQFRFGTPNIRLDEDIFPGAKLAQTGKKYLKLREIKAFHRVYEWAS